MCAAGTEIKPTTPQEASSENDKVSPDEAHMMASKSLLGEDEEDDEEEARPVSRKPNLEDDSEDRGSFFPRASDWETSPINCAREMFPVCQSQLAEQIEHITVRIFVYVEVMMASYASIRLTPVLTICLIQSFTQCQHPMDFLPFFHEHSEREGVERAYSPGMYMLPKTCEYCGSESTDHCLGGCQRPKSFFRKHRPPFCPPESKQWDLKTDFERKKNHPDPKPKKEPERRTSFMALSVFFGGAE
jgi:hypothetical protein